MKKDKKMSEEITGYFVDLPTGANSISVNGGEEVAIASYTDGIITEETETHYGTIEWGAEPEIVEVLIDGVNVPVQPLIAGHHPIARPK